VNSNETFNSFTVIFYDPEKNTHGIDFNGRNIELTSCIQVGLGNRKEKSEKKL
jgi:hypothetical protein